MSPARPALLIDLNKKLNYSILATGGEERASEGGAKECVEEERSGERSERSMRGEWRTYWVRMAPRGG